MLSSIVDEFTVIEKSKNQKIENRGIDEVLNTKYNNLNLFFFIANMYTFDDRAIFFYPHNC